MRLSVDFCPTAGGRHSLAGDTPQRSCLFSSGQSWYAWSLLVTQPHTEHTSCPQCPGAEGEWGGGGGTQVLGFAFCSLRRKSFGDIQRCPQIPGFLSLVAPSLVCPEPCCVMQSHQPHLFLSFSCQLFGPSWELRTQLQEQVSVTFYVILTKSHRLSGFQLFICMRW